MTSRDSPHAAEAGKADFVNDNTSDKLSRGLMMTLLMTVFTCAGTIHYQTPMLGAIGAEFHADAAATGWVATLTFGGFLSGMIFLLPLGDRFDKRKLILIEYFLLIAALVAMAAAPSLAAAAAAGYVIGVCASLAQYIVPMVTELARPEERGRVIGTLLSALFLGILFARIAGGFIAEHFGWRWSYLMCIALLLALAPMMIKRVPSMPAKSSLAYGALIRSLASLLSHHAELRRVAAIQFLLGLSYGGFWATIATMLAKFHGMGPMQAGLMAIPGAAGILIARSAGRWMDKSGVFPVVTTGIGLVFAAYASFLFAPQWIGAVIAGAILMDCGLRAAMVANQTMVNTALPQARSRANTIFGGFVWSGNAVGAFIASTTFAYFGWTSVCTIAMTASVVALIVQWRGAKLAR